MLFSSWENSALWDHRIQEHIRKVPVLAEGLTWLGSDVDCGAGFPSLFSTRAQMLKGLLCAFLLLRNLHGVYRTARAGVISLYERLSASCSDLWEQQLLWLQLRHFETLQMLSLKAMQRIFHVWHLREDPDDCVHLLCKKIISFQGNYNAKCLQTRLIAVWAPRKEIRAAFDLSSLRGSGMDTDILPWAQMQQDLSYREVVGLLDSPALSVIFPTSSPSFQPCRQDMCSSGCYFRTHRLQLTVGTARNHMDLLISLCFNLIFMQRNLPAPRSLLYLHPQWGFSPSMASLIFCVELQTLYLQGAVRLPVPLPLEDIHQIN